MTPTLARLVRLPAVAVCALMALQAATGHAQEPFPNRPITIVVPFPPGGGADAQARLVAQKLGDHLGQPVVVDNRSGAGTAIGAAYVAKARPDGYTMLYSSNSTYTLNPAVRSSLPYDPVKSFEPIGIATRVGMVMLVNAAEPFRTPADLVKAVKAAPDKYSYASFGAGTSSHFAAEIALQAMGVKMLHIPYKGSAPAMTDLIGGQVPVSFDTVTAALPMVKSGKVRALAVTTTRRSPQLPDVPTFAELGWPTVGFDAWAGLVAPRGLPADVHAKLEKALAAVVADPALKKAMADQGVDASFQSSAAASALIDRELPLMRVVAQRADIRAE